MRARTVGYIVAALTPFWLLAILAIQGRFFVSPFAEAEYGSDATRHILAYSQVLRYTALHEKGLNHLDPKALNSVSERWIKYYRTNNLTDIPQISPDDDGSFGFRAEIEAHRRSVIIALTRDLNHQIEEQNYQQAANRIAQLLEIGNVAKYNSTYATFFGATSQLYAIEKFDEVQTKLTPEQRESVRKSIELTVANPEFVVHNSDRLARYSKSISTPDGTKLPSKEEMKVLITRNERTYAVNSNGDSKGMLLAESFRVAYQQEVELQNALSRYRLTALRTN